MARPKRSTLPPDFEARLRSDPLDALIAVFDRCDVDARGGPSRGTAIGFADCPDDLIRWLVAHGADVDARDGRDATPLLRRADSWGSEQIPLLLELGADRDAVDASGRTAVDRAAAAQRVEALRLLLAAGAGFRGDDSPEPTLVAALRHTANISIGDMADVAELLIDAGATVTDAMRDEVTRIGQQLEFFRPAFAASRIDEVDAGLTRLYARFGVTPVPRRLVHDGTSRIEVRGGDWRERFESLRAALVPATGPAASAQGEVIRITGRLSHEILDDGGVNWGEPYRVMLTALDGYLGSGEPLAEAELAETRRLTHGLRTGRGDEADCARLTELGVEWVAASPEPLAPLASEIAR